MKFNDETVHERNVFCHINQTELHALISRAVAESAGFPLDANTKARVTLGTLDTGGRREDYAEVKLTNDLKEVPPGFAG